MAIFLHQKEYASDKVKKKFRCVKRQQHAFSRSQVVLWENQVSAIFETASMK
jgi:hypothetical protein